MRLAMRAGRVRLRHRPIIAYIEPTSFCNLRCPACPTGLRLDLRPRDAIDPQRFDRALDELGDYVFKLYLYNWGEPFLHKQTPEMIAGATARGISVRLSSNLSLPLSDAYIERIVRSGLDHLVVSLDGTSEQTYARYRRAGSFDLVRANLRRIAETKQRLGLATPHIEWQFLVFAHNEHEIEQVPRLYRDWGADSYVITGAQMPEPPHDEGFAAASRAQYNIYHPDNPVQQQMRASRRRTAPCSWLYGVAVLNPSGTVSPCCGTAAQRDDFATYQPEQGFLAAWNSSTFRHARRQFRPDAPARPAPLPLVEETIQAMGVPASNALRAGETICDRCPMPFYQDFAETEIDAIAAGLLRQAVRGRDPRAALRLLAMGGPPPRLLRRLAAARLPGSRRRTAASSPG